MDEPLVNEMEDLVETHGFLNILKALQVVADRHHMASVSYDLKDAVWWLENLYKPEDYNAT
jgi:hypothetical protein